MMYVWGGLILFSLLVYRSILGQRQRARARNRKRRPMRLVQLGTFDVAVVGASHYQDNLARLAGGKKSKSANKIVTAVLIHEDVNPYDNEAVRVDVDGMTVGYLGRSDARDYRDLLERNGHAGVSFACAAKIVGGWFRSPEDQGHFGVRLDLETE